MSDRPLPKTGEQPARNPQDRRKVRGTRIDEWVERQLATAPPLSQASRDRLAALLGSPSEHAPT